ncbi:MAG: helix-turn-helix transcriptional regulator [Clostridia bacterium]|nr:helix-turn-helix transcriptional regulator [Clostridia bacterium]
MKLHEKIFNQRKLRGMSQEELAEKVGVSRQAVSKWETGEALPEITKLKALADLFGVTTDFLLDDSKDSFNAAPEAKPDAIDRVLLYIEALPEKLKPFLKKYGWLGGIVLIISGIYRVVSIFFSLVVLGDMPSGVTGFAAPMILQMLLQGLIGFATVIAGIVVIKKFRPKK